MAEMMRGLGGLGKTGNQTEKKDGIGERMKGKADPNKMEKGKVDGEADDAGSKVHELHDHGDGTFHTEMHDGTKTEHPDHLHALAHMGHHVTGGEKHHVVHHDGMGITSHGIHEDGTHDGPHEHSSTEEAKQAMGKFFDEESQEPSHQDSSEEESMPSYGGMNA